MWSRFSVTKGRDEGEFAVYLEQKEKLLSVHAWTIDATGHEYELKDNEKDFCRIPALFSDSICITTFGSTGEQLQPPTRDQ